MQIIFEDEELLVAHKPVHILTEPNIPPKMGSKPMAENLNANAEPKTSLLQELVKNFTELQFLQAAHRLDYDTSGLVIFCKNKKSLAKVSQQFEKRQVKKTYHAICHIQKAIAKKSWNCEKALIRDERNVKLRWKTSTSPKATSAYTHFQVIVQNEKFAVIEAHPKTGRTHQIRVHLHSEGLPIAGDPFYGVKDNLPTMFLHATRLFFHHPVTEKELLLESPPEFDYSQFGFDKFTLPAAKSKK